MGPRNRTDADGQPTARAISDARLADRTIDELVGFCRGVVADEVVNLQEAQQMLRWLKANVEQCDAWPYNTLYARLADALADDDLDEEEQRQLIDLLVHITGGDIPVDERIASYASSLPLTQPPPDLVFQGSSFCLTGRFIFGTRKKCEDAIRARGGKPKSHVSPDIQYVVIGSMGSRDWAHSTFGRKIEDAVALGLAIVSEGYWLECIDQVNPHAPTRLSYGQEVFAAYRLTRNDKLDPNQPLDTSALPDLVAHHEILWEIADGLLAARYIGGARDLIGRWALLTKERAPLPDAAPPAIQIPPGYEITLAWAVDSDGAVDEERTLNRRQLAELITHNKKTFDYLDDCVEYTGTDPDLAGTWLLRIERRRDI